MIQLYSYWRSTAAYRVRIALALKGIEHEIVTVDLVKDGGEQHSADYQRLNPSELVPTLVDDKKTITQSAAIIEYIEECYGGIKLLPEEAAQRGQVRALAQIIACDIHPLNNLRVLQYLKGEMEQPQPAVDRWYKHWVEKGFSAIEQQLKASSGDYCFSNQLSLADVFLIPQVYNANRFKVPLDNFPRIREINNRCLQLREFQVASPENQAGATN